MMSRRMMIIGVLFGVFQACVFRVTVAAEAEDAFVPMMEGYVDFQDEAKRVWYRNVRIKELSPTETKK